MRGMIYLFIFIIYYILYSIGIFTFEHTLLFVIGLGFVFLINICEEAKE